MNKVFLIGRLTKDPEFKLIPVKGTPVAKCTIAINRRISKEKKETDFIPIIAWNKTAEILANFTVKGSLICIAGRIQTRPYEDKEGGKRYITEVVVDEVEFLDKKGQNADMKSLNESNSEPSNESNVQGTDVELVEDGDIPF